MSLESVVTETVSKELLLSELYAEDTPDAVLLAEYPSSNSDQTRFRNIERFIIHDPFPPPPAELLKCLGPHHLMFGWGNSLAVTSQAIPPASLMDHWCEVLGPAARPNWIEFDQLSSDQRFIVLFPHESLTATQQSIDPEVNYFLHSKEVIEQIKCPQADVLGDTEYPCIVKLSHGYAGLSNYILRNEADERAMRETLAERWPGAKLVINSIVENIVGDFGVQFYLRRDGSAVWLGFTEQKFDQRGKWCGGSYSAARQLPLAQDVAAIIAPVAEYLARQGCFGVIGIDILRDANGEQFLVDVNPRLTGITPFVMASRVFSTDAGLVEGEYRASCKFSGRLDELLERSAKTTAAKVVVLSAFDDQNSGHTICHLSVTADTQATCTAVFDELLGRDHAN